MMKSTTILAATVIGILVVAASPARADDKADALFKKGKKLLESKRYADACAAFEDSNKIDPGIGIELNIAHCYEEWGKLATAYRRYTEAAAMAKRDHDPRITRITERLNALEDQVPRIVVRVPKGASTDGLVVLIDGAKLPISQLGEPQLADPGPHTVDYRIGDTAKREMIVPVEAGETRETKLPLRVLEASEQVHSTSSHTQTVEVIGHGQRVAGVVIGSAGIVAVAASVVITLSARSKYRSALASDCGGVTNACDPAGLSATHDARSEANIASIVFGVGAAAIIGGIVTYVIAPTGLRAEHHETEDEAFYVTPTLTDSGGVGFAFGGRL